jgi:hypothetical protein
MSDRALERLLPGKCDICGGSGRHLIDCEKCHGSGQLWDEGITEAVARTLNSLSLPLSKDSARAVLAAIVGALADKEAGL